MADCFIVNPVGYIELMLINTTNELYHTSMMSESSKLACSTAEDAAEGIADELGITNRKVGAIMCNTIFGFHHC